MKQITTVFIVTFFGAIALAACRTGPEPVPHLQSSVEIAKQACEIHALAEEHQTMMTRVGAIEAGAPTTISDSGETILMEKLKQYRADIDATYRFVTSNCNNYNLCMQMNHYREIECASSRAAWTTSHERFNQLALELAKLEVPPHGQPPHHPHHPCAGTHCKAPRNDCNANKCGDSIGLFSTGCCYDGD
jgi:hypothetical protein